MPALAVRTALQTYHATVERGVLARVASALPQVRIVTMPGLGHYPSDERPDAFQPRSRRLAVKVAFWCSTV